MDVSSKRARQRGDEKPLDIVDFAKETDFGDLTETTEVDKPGTPDMRAAVVALYDAFARGDRGAFETLITDDFRFTSPYDDAIDRAEFFERCWPNHERMQELAVKRVAIDGAGAFVTYDVLFHDGHRAQNTEWLAFRDGKVTSVDVYFGAAHASSREHHVDWEARDHAVELARLEPIIGTWTLTGENAPRERTEPDPASLRLDGEETYEAMVGGFFVVGRWTHRFPDGGEHTGISVLGHEPDRGSIMCENFDNLGYAREYRVAIDGDTWTLTGAHERATYKFTAGGEAFTVVWESSKDGREWRPLCRLEGRKRNGQ